MRPVLAYTIAFVAGAVVTLSVHPANDGLFFGICTMAALAIGLRCYGARP